MILKNRIYVILNVILILSSCEVLFDAPNKNNIDLITINATLVDTLNGPPIKLSISKINKTSNTSSISYISSATIEIIENNELKTQFIESNILSGYYYPPKKFYAKENKKYTLNIILPDGSRYFSTTEGLPKSKPIVNDVFSQLVTFQENEFAIIPKAKHGLFIDLNDPKGEDNYYKINYRYFEEQEICNKTANYPIIATPCRYMCWDSFESTREFILSDRLSDGKIIKKFSIGEIPYNQPFPTLIQVSALSISKSAFEYWKIIQDQTEKTGTLADTPPTAFLGNMISENPNSVPVIGYFQLAKLAKVNYILKRDDVESYITPNFIRERIDYLQTSRPCSPGFNCKCIESYDRTSILPDGWLLPTRRILQPIDFKGERKSI